MTRPRSWRGYRDIGPMTWPPVASPWLMTDLADGTIWSVGVNADGRVTLTTATDAQTARARKLGSLYGAYDGPAVRVQEGQGLGAHKRLLVRSGRLGYESASAGGAYPVTESPENKFWLDTDSSPLSYEEVDA